MLRKIFLATRFCDFVQVRLIRIMPNNVDGSVEVHARMLIAIFLRFCCQNVVIGNLHEIKFYFSMPVLSLEPIKSSINDLLRSIFSPWPMLFEQAEGILRVSVNIIALSIGDSLHFLA